MTNDIKVAGSPLAIKSEPYFFVFLSTSSYYDGSFEWAPDAPAWHLAPGTYQYVIMLSDYAEKTGHFTVGTAPMTLAVTLHYHPASGVYTPLWAFSNGQLAGISSSGAGTIAHQYILFNNPTSSCTKCGGAVDDNLSSYFFSANDYLYPTFAGILLDGTNAYTEVLNPPSFCTFWFSWGSGPASTDVCFDLQLEFVSAKHVTLAHADVGGGWPAMFEVEADLGAVDPTQNFFPQGSVMFWNSSNNLVMSSTFVPTINPPFPGYGTPVTCFFSCISPDALLFYGGSHNTVWGNTFHDPTVPATGDAFASWAGLAESESGDLIYNNNFSIDNPVVWLPFDMYPGRLSGRVCGPVRAARSPRLPRCLGRFDTAGEPRLRRRERLRPLRKHPRSFLPLAGRQLLEQLWEPTEPDRQAPVREHVQLLRLRRLGRPPARDGHGAPEHPRRRRLPPAPARAYGLDPRRVHRERASPVLGMGGEHRPEPLVWLELADRAAFRSGRGSVVLRPRARWLRADLDHGTEQSDVELDRRDGSLLVLPYVRAGHLGVRCATDS